MDIYNCHQISVSNCLFENNGPVVITKTEPWRGHAGGLSIAFHYLQVLNVTSSVILTNNKFLNNSVQTSVSGRQTTSQLLRDMIATGRGGGCAINTNSVTSVDVTIYGGIFERNYALSYGGGLYLAWGGALGRGHTITINSTMFIENESGGGAGGLEIGFSTGGKAGIANRVFGYDLQFIRNKAITGGGTFVFIGGM